LISLFHVVAGFTLLASDESPDLVNLDLAGLHPLDFSVQQLGTFQSYGFNDGQNGVAMDSGQPLASAHADSLDE
jgi:hypothetical protein